MPERVAIIGSRRRTDLESVAAVVAALPPGTVVVSGGCRGPDQWAEEAARARGLAVAVHEPDMTGATARFQRTQRYHARNQRIVDHCDRLVAFVAPDRKGGTEDTIRRAQRAGKAVTIL